MACPDCGSSFGECLIASSIETHGLDCGPCETFEQEYIVCRGCGGKFDIRDWESAPEPPSEVPEAALVGLNLPLEDRTG